MSAADTGPAADPYGTEAPPASELRGLAQRVGEELGARGWTLALAESCTGGLIAKLVTDVPGSGEYFEGGVVTYSNRSKERLLEVRPATLRQAGAVSEAAAREMAEGAARVLEAVLGLSVTGIAGPGGGSPGKPVGTVWFGLKISERVEAERALLPGDRDEIRHRAARYALRFLLEALGGHGYDHGAEPGVANPSSLHG